ncbi:MAG: secondary thiamine-phosphate synthase enzyme YjbQ [Pseudomonadota bacterium]
MRERLVVTAPAQGLHPLTDALAGLCRDAGCRQGLMHLFLQHTSASLIVQENADPAVQRDLEAFLARLVPEDDPLYTHTEEGPDDMPAHVKGALTAVSMTLPVAEGALALGTWQGVFLWEHRRRPRPRALLVTVTGVVG